MDLNTLISQFFTDEEVKRAFTSICGTVEDGGYPITKYNVIDEFNEPLQRICDFINGLQNHINNLIVTRNNPIIATIEGCKRDTVSKPSLSSNLDEAAEGYTQKMLESWRFDSTGCRPPRESFKAGANWQKSQMLKDVYVESQIVEDGRIELEGEPLPCLNPIILLPYPQFKPGDRVHIIVLKDESK